MPLNNLATTPSSDRNLSTSEKSLELIQNKKGETPPDVEICRIEK